METRAQNEEDGGGACRCAIITVSDTETIESDQRGLEILDLVRAASHHVLERTVVPHDPARIHRILRHWLGAAVDAIFLSGDGVPGQGVGLVDVVRPFLEKELPGFAEILRHLAFREMGPAAILVETVAGFCRGKALFAIPGSKDILRRAVESLILPVLPHVVARARLQEKV